GRPRVGFVVTSGHEGIFARCLGGVAARLSSRHLEVQVLCSLSGSNVLRQVLPEANLSFLILPARVDEAVAIIRAAKFDLLFYWEIGTDATNYFLPFYRAAPLQMASWGWPTTSGNACVSHYCSAR